MKKNAKEIKTSSDIWWETLDGRFIAPSKMSHSHLSNIIWFFRVFFSKQAKVIHPSIEAELNSRFNGILLPYMPPIVLFAEIQRLVEKGLTDGKIGSDIFLNGSKIGMITEDSVENIRFKDILGWNVCYIKDGEHKEHTTSYWIYNPEKVCVAFLGHNGKFRLITKRKRINDNAYSSYVEEILTSQVFNPKTEIKQAVRYAYLMTQKPLQ